MCSAVAGADCSFRSTATTSAAAWAKATAVARPMPEPAPVTNVTLPENLRLLLVVMSNSSDRQERFYGAAFVHGAVALGDPLQRERQVEHLAGFDGARADQVHELGQEAPDGGRTTV